MLVIYLLELYLGRAKPARAACLSPLQRFTRLILRIISVRFRTLWSLRQSAALARTVLFATTVKLDSAQQYNDKDVVHPSLGCSIFSI